MLEIRLFGQFDLRVGGQPASLPSRPAQAMLAYLVMQAGVAHRREKLAALLWPDIDEAGARKNLRQALWQARKALGSAGPGTDYLLADELTIAFNSQANYWLDVAVLEGAAKGPCSAEELTAAVSAYRGELLPGFYDEWAVLERERLEALFDRVMQGLLDRLLAEERWREVLEWSERWIALGHVPEPAYRALMQAHSHLGDTAAAAAAFQRCRAALREQLGVEPSALTASIYATVAQRRKPVPPPIAPAGVDALPARVSAPLPVAGPPPFQGLRCFEEEDAARFFGREAVIEKLAARLKRGEAVTVVVGASGSGKSSLVRAGLIPALLGNAGEPEEGAAPQRFAWRAHLLTPTAHPLRSLAASLARDANSLTAVTGLMDDLARDQRCLGLAAERLLAAPFLSLPGNGGKANEPRLLLVVDQFEELFTLCRDEAERRAFIDNLFHAAGAGSLLLVIALRADFYPHCAGYPALRNALAACQEYIGPMSAEELRRAIEGPARLGGWDFEPGVVDLILRDVGDEPGSLPLLSHALLETWRRRSSRTLTLASYAASGGVHGALARTAERIFYGLSEENQALARGIFLRLTELGEGTQDTRRRASLGELAPRREAEPAVRAILEALAQARLITLAEGTAEVAHEALIREWPTLRGWLAADREGLRLHRRLTEAAAAWAGLDRDPGELYRGARLAQALEWGLRHQDELNPLEQEFLDASRELAEREAAEQEAHRLRELETARRLAETESLAARRLRHRALLLSAALVLAAGLAATALLLARQAENQARIARGREWAAAALGNLQVDPERSVLLALQAVNETYRGGQVLPEAQDALHRAVPEARVRFTLVGHKGAVRATAYSPDGTRLATLGADGYLKVWNTANGQIVQSFLAHHAEGGFGMAFSPDGSLIATGASSYEGVRIWRWAAGQEVRTLQFAEKGPILTAYGLAFSPDGRRLAVANDDGTTRVYDPFSGQELLRIAPRQGDGQLVTSARSVAFSPDGRLIAVAYLLPSSQPESPSPTVHLFDATTGRRLLSLPAPSGVHAMSYNSVAFSPDGTQLATAEDGHTARLWEVTTGKLLRSFAGHTAEVERVAFSADGSRLATASLDGTARVWNVADGRELVTLAGHSGGVLDVAFTPSSGATALATASADGTARIWDVALAHEWLTLDAGVGAISGLAYNADGSRIAASGDRRLAAIWDTVTARPALTVTLPTGEGSLSPALFPVNSMAFSPDGARVALASPDYQGKITVNDAASGRILATIGDLYLGTTRAIAFSPDGAHLATGNFEKMARVWDASTGRRLLTLAGHSAPVEAIAYNPAGTRIVTGSDDGQVKLWDAATGLTLVTLNDAHAGSVWSVAFSPDGSRLATAGRDGTARVWSLPGLDLQHTLSGHIADVRAVAWSPDGKLLATGSGDTTVKVWDASSGQELYTLYGHTDVVSAVAFSPDGSRLAAASHDGTVRFYLLRIDDLLALARSRVTRSLTLDECRKYLHLDRCPAP